MSPLDTSPDDSPGDLLAVSIFVPLKHPHERVPRSYAPDRAGPLDVGRTAHAVYGVTVPAPMAARANESGGHGPLRDGAAPAWRRDADDDDETAPRTRVALP